MPRLKGKLPKIEPSSEKEFELIIPDTDNSENPIDKSKVHKEFMLAVTERFGGVTTFPSAIGCEQPEDDSDGMHCEPATVFDFDRDWDDPNTEEVMEEEGVDTRKALLEEDRKFLHREAIDIADRLNQFGVMMDEENVDVELAFGERKDTAEDEVLTGKLKDLKDLVFR